MNLWSVTALGIGAMVGAGIFAVLGQAAVIAGRDTYLAFMLGGGVAALSGYSYAKLAVRYPDAGGVSEYFDRAFGAARLSGCLSLIYMFTIAVTVALVAKAFGAYAAPLVFGDSHRLWVNIFASAIVVLLTLLNVQGSGLVGRAEVVLVGIKLVILTGLMIAGALSLEHAAPIAQQPVGPIGVVGAVGLTFLAYAGYDNTANAASSVANAHKTIPRAMSLAIGAVILLYVGLSLVVLASVPAAQLALHSDTAVAEAARPILGQAGYVVVSVGALLATASGINAWIFNGMNISLSLSNAGQLPHLFTQVVWRNGTRGVLVSVAAILLVLNAFDLGALTRLASAGFLITYLGVQVAHWRLLRETKASKVLVAAGFVALATVLGCFLWTTAAAQPWSMALMAALIIVSWIVETALMPKAAALTRLDRHSDSPSTSPAAPVSRLRDQRAAITHDELR